MAFGVRGSGRAASGSGFHAPEDLLAYVPFEHLSSHHRAVDVALRVDAESFGSRVIGHGRFGILDEGRHRAVPGAADADALLDAGNLVCAGVGPGFGIGDIDGVVTGDDDAAGAAELSPLVEEPAL